MMSQRQQIGKKQQAIAAVLFPSFPFYARYLSSRQVALTPRIRHRNYSVVLESVNIISLTEAPCITDPATSIKTPYDCRRLEGDMQIEATRIPVYFFFFAIKEYHRLNNSERNLILIILEIVKVKHQSESSQQELCF